MTPKSPDINTDPDLDPENTVYPENTGDLTTGKTVGKEKRKIREEKGEGKEREGKRKIREEKGEETEKENAYSYCYDVNLGPCPSSQTRQSHK